MTLGEFTAYANGANKEQELGLEVAAIHASWLLQPHAKKGKRITPAMLLGKEKSVDAASFDNWDSFVAATQELANG